MTCNPRTFPSPNTPSASRCFVVTPWFTAQATIRWCGFQVGRLRRKLAEHYVTTGLQDPIRLSIPAGCYRLACQRLRPEGIATRHPVLQIQPFTCITLDGDDFTRGLCEELSCRLFESFEQTRSGANHVLMRVPRNTTKATELVRGGRGNYSLEGSVRVEPARVRAVAPDRCRSGADSLVGAVRSQATLWHRHSGRSGRVHLPVVDGLFLPGRQ